MASFTPWQLTFFLLIAVLNVSKVSSRSFGAPADACSTLSPNPGAHGAAPQLSNVPYEIDTSVFRDPTTGELLYTPNSNYQSEF